MILIYIYIYMYIMTNNIIWYVMYDMTKLIVFDIYN